MEPKWIKDAALAHKITANGGPLNRLGCGGGLGRPSANESNRMLANPKESYGILGNLSELSVIRANH